MGEPAIWWYERDGRQAGPVPHASILELVRSGQLAADARVWRPGMPGWEVVRRVPEVAAALPQPTPLPGAPPMFPSPAGPTPVLAAPRAPTPVPAPPAGLEPVSWGVLVALTLVTFGVYGIYRYYLAARSYEALAGRVSRFATWFWICLGIAAADIVLGALGGLLGFTVVLTVSVVFGILSLLEALAVRGEGLRRRGVWPQTTADTTYRALGIAAAATWWSGIGFIVTIVLGVLFFQDHDAIARAVAARPTPAPASLGAAPAARACAACGNPLAPPARFCDRCGAAV